VNERVLENIDQDWEKVSGWSTIRGHIASLQSENKSLLYKELEAGLRELFDNNIFNDFIKKMYFGYNSYK